MMKRTHLTLPPIARPLAHICCLLALAGCGERAPAFYAGYVEADYVRLASPLAGTLARSYVARGAAVKPGDPVFVLEQDNERAARLAAQAHVQRAQATLDDLRKGRRPLELDVVQAQLAQAQAAARLSQADLDRERRLVAARFVAPARMDELRAAVQRDAARVRELQAQAGVARLGARPDTLRAAEDDVRAAEAELAQADWSLARKTVTAPVAGTVADVLYREGELVPAGTPVATVLAQSNIRARFFVPERALGQVRLGQDLRLRCDGCPAGLAARVSYVSREAEYTAPLIYSRESRANLVFRVDATPYGPGIEALHPGLPLEVTPVP
jgi:HlyD family secretion protein